MYDFTFIDLFCGIGSFHVALKQLGGRCVFASDINPAVIKTYTANFGIEPKGDICKVDVTDIPDFDVLCAGFPCQPFSNIGQQKGFEDDRGTLIYQITRILTEKQPKAFILENVKGLVSHNSGTTFKKVIAAVESCGYVVHWNVLSCNDYGIPQMRKRLFIVGVRKDLYSNDFDFNLPKRSTPTLSQFMGRGFEKNVAYTIRCGGRRSKIGDRHNWDSYVVDGTVYTLSIEDMKKLQGFDDAFLLYGSEKQKEVMLGNTIPTNLTLVVGQAVVKYLKDVQ